MKLILGLLAISSTVSTVAFASDIFVARTIGHLTRKQATDVTNQIKSSVRETGKNSIATRAADADFVLQPSIITRGGDMLLRIEKEKNGEIFSMSEQTIGSVADVRARATGVVDMALTGSPFGTAYALDTDDDTGSDSTTSATSVSASDIDETTSGGPIEVSGNASNAAASPATRTDSTSTYSTEGVDSTASSPGADASVGELTSASPRMLNSNRIGQVQLGVGPSFGINMKDDSLMYDLMAAYAISFSENWVGKVFGDFNIATGSSVTHFINLGVAGEFYPSRELLTFGKPYLAADLGYAFARDALNRTGDGLSAGVGAGFKFQAAQMNWDVAANYTLLLSQVADKTPSVFGIRVALGF